jgi:hypothetical protein
MGGNATKRDLGSPYPIIHERFTVGRHSFGSVNLDTQGETREHRVTVPPFTTLLDRAIGGLSPAAAILDVSSETGEGPIRKLVL